MAVTIVGTAGTYASGTGGWTVTPPVGTVGGVAVVAVYHTATVTPPSGWTLVNEFGPGNFRLRVYVGAPGMGSSWGVVGDSPVAITVAGYDAEVELVSLTGASGAASPSITAAADDLVIRGFGDWPDDTASRTAPTGTTGTQMSGASGGMWAGMAHNELVAAGATGTATWLGGTIPWLPFSVTALVRAVDTEPPVVTQRFVSTVSGRHFLDQNGDPVLLKGDSPWTAMANTTPAQWETYCAYLASRGFNAIILDLVPLPAGGGPEARAQAETYDGLKPFTSFSDWSTASGAYWSRVDTFVATAETYGLSVALVPAYASQGSIGAAVDVLDGQTTTQIQGYGTFLGNRYKAAPNILWFLGGDFGAPPGSSPTNEAIWADYSDTYVTLHDAIVATGDAHLWTGHLAAVLTAFPTGGISWDNAATRSQADYEFAYSYQVTHPVIRRARATSPKPVIFGEGNYSGENNWAGPATTNETLRRALLWSYSSGAAGDFMGTEQWRGASGWVSSIPRTAFVHAQHIHEAFESVAWWKLEPDVSNVFLTSGQGTSPTSGTQEDGHVDPLESTYATAARANDGTVAVVYVPTGRSFTIDTAKLGASPTGVRVDPTDGTTTAFTVTSSYTSPGNNAAGQSDWIYLFEASPLAQAAEFSGSGSLSASVLARMLRSAAFTGSGALTAAAESTTIVERAANFAGAGALSASRTIVGTVAAGFTGTGSLSAVAVPRLVRTAGLAGSGGLSAAVVPRAAVAAALTGSGSLTALVQLPNVLYPVFTGVGSLSAVAVIGSVTVAVSAPFTGLGVLSAVAVTPVFVFTPPTFTERWPVDDVFFRRLTVRRSVSVLKESGFYRQSVPGQVFSAEEITAADVAYLGGHAYPVDEAEVLALTAAGYGEFIEGVPV